MNANVQITAAIIEPTKYNTMPCVTVHHMARAMTQANNTIIILKEDSSNTLYPSFRSITRDCIEKRAFPIVYVKPIPSNPQK